MAKKAGGMRVVQLRLAEADALALAGLARMARTTPEQVVTYWTRRSLSELQAQIERIAVPAEQPAEAGETLRMEGAWEEGTKVIEPG